MSNIINPDLISQALKQAEVTTPAPVPAAPNPSDCQKFQSALATPPAQGVEAVNPAQAPAPESVKTVSEVDPQSKAPGDDILNQIHKISHQLSGDDKFIQDTLKNMGTDSLSPEDMLKLQYHLAQMTTDTALTTSIASDLKKGITTLMSNQ